MERKFLQHLTSAIGTCAALATLFSVSFNIEWIKGCICCGLLVLVLIILIAYIYACWQTRSKSKITLDLSAELKLTIAEGDLFEQKGIICIPVNEYFDTHVGEGVISEESTHGIFINKYFKDRIPELKKRMNKLLEKESPLDEHPRRVAGCPTKRYPLGTCIHFREGENTYVLFALTHFDDNDKANVSRAEYTEVTRKLMQYLNPIVGGESVYMPLYGTKFSRMRRTSQRILLHLVDSLDFDDTATIPGGLHVVINSLSKLNVNLTMLEQVVKTGISKT